MPFRFKMQKVLDYREQLEEEAKVNLAVQQTRLAEARERLEQIRQELHQAEDGLMNAALMDAPERWLREQYVKGLRADAIQVRMLEQLAEEARQLLAARAIDKKLLEKLKERQKQHHVREEQLKEQRINDETATLRYKAPTF